MSIVTIWSVFLNPVTYEGQNTVCMVNIVIVVSGIFPTKSFDAFNQFISLNHVIVGVSTKVLFGRWFDLLSPLST